MATVGSLRSIWEKADSSYIQTTKYGRRNPVNRRSFSEIKNEMNRSGNELQKTEEGSESYCDDISEGSSSQKAFVNFDAIPEEFRPSKQGRNLLKVRTSPNKSGLKENVNSEEQLRNERFPIKSNVSQRKRFTANYNSSPIQNESRNCKKEALIEDPEQKVTNLISQEPGEQKKLSGIFFYKSSSRNESISKETQKCQQNWSGRENKQAESSEKSKLRDEILHNSNSNRSRATKSYFAQNKDEINLSKSNKNALPAKTNHTVSSQNKAFFIGSDNQKTTRETIATKRITWKNDLCRFKKTENIFYEYTETTKESMNYAPSSSEDEEEERKRSNRDFKKERTSFNNLNFPASGYRNRKDERFDSKQNFQRKAANHFTSERHQMPVKKFEEAHTCVQCGSGRKPIIVKHEIKVFHMNGRKGNNRKIQNSSQVIHPPAKGRNVKIFNTDTREHSGAVVDKTRKDAMTETVEVVQQTRKLYLRPSLKLTDSSSNAEYAKTADSRTSNNDSNDNTITLIKYGREISDMIAGSFVAISTFLDNYEQWKDFRRVTMLLFEELENNLSQSTDRNKRIIEIAEMVDTGCKMVQYVPHSGVSIAAKIVAFLSDVVLRMFSSSKSAKSIGLDDFQLRLCLQEDMDATSDIYLYGMQCDIQFQETCQLIEEFHHELQNGRYEKIIETFETGFLKEISLLNPNHPEVFYKRLGRSYKILNDHQQSEESRAFCGAFEDWPDALSIISRLYRRFKKEKWDSSSVLKAWEEIYNLLQNDQSVVEDVLRKIQDCICVLMKEQSIMEKYVVDLQKQS